MHMPSACVPMNKGSITDKNANLFNNVIGGAADYEAQMMRSGGFYPNNQLPNIMTDSIETQSITKRKETNSGHTPVTRIKDPIFQPRVREQRL